MRSSALSEFGSGLSDVARELRVDSEWDHLDQYAEDPLGFVDEKLGVRLTDEIREMLVSVRDNPVTVMKSANAVGKTHGAAICAIWWYKCRYMPQVWATAAPPENNLRSLLWGEIISQKDRLASLFAGDKITDLSIARSSRSFIRGVLLPVSGTPSQREARFSGKHAPNILFIVDEGDAVYREAYKGIKSCMSGGIARLLVMFNPRKDEGPVYEMEKKREAKVITIPAFNHPNVVTGDNVIPGAVTRDSVVDRINRWSRDLRPHETLDRETFLIPDHLEGAVAVREDGREYPPLKAGYRKATEPEIMYMVLARYPTSLSHRLVLEEWIDKAEERWERHVTRYGEVLPAGSRMGLDVADEGVDLNVAMYRAEDYLHWPDRWKGLDTLETAERGVSLARLNRTEYVMVDATGVGSAVVPKMRRLGVRALRVFVSRRATQKAELGEFVQMRDQLLWATREWLRSDRAMMPPNAKLREELLIPDYGMDNGRIKAMTTDKMRDILGRSPDDMMALALTFYPHTGVRKSETVITSRQPYA